MKKCGKIEIEYLAIILISLAVLLILIFISESAREKVFDAINHLKFLLKGR